MQVKITSKFMERFPVAYNGLLSRLKNPPCMVYVYAVATAVSSCRTEFHGTGIHVQHGELVVELS